LSAASITFFCGEAILLGPGKKGGNCEHGDAAVDQVGKPIPVDFSQPACDDIAE
jgi:hypothetical protein